MQASIPCPKCKEFALYRSHSKNIIERTVKRFFPFKIYRCRSCGWRGWLSKHTVLRRRPASKTFLFYLAVIVISLIAAMFLKRMF